jgi:hypothetical protein
VENLEDSVIRNIGNGKKDEDSSTEVLDPLSNFGVDLSGDFLKSFLGGLAKAHQPWWKG